MGNVVFRQLFVALVTFFVLGLSGSVYAANSASEDPVVLLSKAKSWGYQLQGLKLGPLLRSTYDLLVIDAGTPYPGSEYTTRDLRRLKRKPDGTRRLVVAYMNIGEAEDYRYYWKTAWADTPPDWMGHENCRWRGDHRVKFWMPEWQRIILGSSSSYLDRLIAMGFDGVFLDRVDIYRYWRYEKEDTYSDMVRFVREISAYARKKRPDFLVIPQNGEWLLKEASYREVISAQAKEDLIFGVRGNGVRNEKRLYRTSRDLIRYATKNDIPVFAIEYLRDGNKIESARQQLLDLGIIPYFGPRSLSSLGIHGALHPEDRQTEPLMDEARQANDC